jgi:phosphoribosylaminoimidazole-succinocarboxamide synthase
MQQLSSLHVQFRNAGRTRIHKEIDDSLRRLRRESLEMVVRGNLTGHAWRTYSSGVRILSGVTMPEGLKENDYFPYPIITPSTKAESGHDEDISKKDIIANKIAGEKEYEVLEKYTLALFERGKDIAAKRELILVDTKYEFGKIGDTIYLMDEIHTPDSSRYFYVEGFEERQEKGEKQKQLSKEFVREWLIANGFMGKSGQQVPLMTDEWKWVLRSSHATRPVLRLQPGTSSSRTASMFSDTTGMVRVSAGDGNLSSGNVQQDMGTAFAVATSVKGSARVHVSGNLGYAASGVPSAGFRTTYSHDADGAAALRGVGEEGLVGARNNVDDGIADSQHVEGVGCHEFSRMILK